MTLQPAAQFIHQVGATRRLLRVAFSLNGFVIDCGITQSTATLLRQRFRPESTRIFMAVADLFRLAQLLLMNLIRRRKHGRIFIRRMDPAQPLNGKKSFVGRQQPIMGVLWW